MGVGNIDKKTKLDIPKLTIELSAMAGRLIIITGLLKEHTDDETRNSR